MKKLAAPQLESRRAQVRDKLAGEPGFISLMSADPPSLPASSVSGNVAQTSLAKTVNEAPVVPAAMATGYGSAEPTTSDTSHSHPAGVPKPRSMAPVVVALLALCGGAAIFFMATHKTQPAPAASSTTQDVPAPIASSATAESSTQPIATMTPSAHPSARPAITATHTHAATATTHTSAPVPSAAPASTDPPPNPY